MHPWEQLEREVGLDRWLAKDRRERAASRRKELLVWFALVFGGAGLVLGAVFVAVTPLPEAPAPVAAGGLQCTTNGCRINFGAGENDFYAPAPPAMTTTVKAEFVDAGSVHFDARAVRALDTQSLISGAMRAPGVVPVPRGSTCTCAAELEDGRSVSCLTAVRGSTLLVATDHKASVRWFCWL